MARRLCVTAGVMLFFVIGSTGTGALAAEETPSDENVSPARRVQPQRSRGTRRPNGIRSPRLVRSIDGVANNPIGSEMNATNTPLARVMAADYADGVAAMRGDDRAGARAVSNLLCDQAESTLNDRGTSDYLWQWGQFVDHDIDLTDGTDPPELAPIAVPIGDIWFDPDGEGSVAIVFNRSIYDHDDAVDAARSQLNEVTGWIDASNVYGSDTERATALRTLDGTGRLRTGAGGLLPDDDTDLPNAQGGSSELMFLAGDVRANEQVGLTALHTLFVREHNRVADRIRGRHAELDGDAVYERARQFVGGLMQAITYNEFLPALLGRGALAPYHGYEPGVDARIANAFSTAAYRFGHSALSPNIPRLDGTLQEIPEGSLALRDAFFSPDRLRDEGGIEPILRGLATQRHQRIDAMIIDDVRNFLFGAPGQGGFDLAALNLQRGRDHGLPTYAASRVAYGFPAAETFADVTSDVSTAARLAAAYETVDDVDLWAGGLAEDPVPGGHLGPLFSRMIAEQFEALRDGDRFWYERALPQDLVYEIQATRLSDVIRRNTSIDGEIADDVFRVIDDSAGHAPQRPRRPRR